MTQRVTTQRPDAAAVRSEPPSLADGGAELFTWLRKMRHEAPVWCDPRGVYHVFRYHDVQYILGAVETFSSDRSATMPNADLLALGNLTMMDPPNHRRLRRLASQAFTPKVVAGLTPRISEIMTGLLDDVADDEFDWMERVASRLPVTVIAELLGVPPADHDMCRTWATGFGGAVESAVREMSDYMLARCRQRRQHPHEDLISHLVTCEVDGEQLTDDEVAQLCGLLLLAGYITTTMMLGNMVICLDENPGAAAQLRTDRTLIPAAVEEVLRYRAPFMQVGRVTTTDAQVGAQTIPAGSYVMVWLLSANHDERQFPDPGRFDIHRSLLHRQIAFGHGIHFCLGTPLARLEGKIALEQLLDRFADIRITPGVDVPYIGGAIFGVKRLPVTVCRAR